MKNGIENGYYHEITPAGFGIAIKAGKVLFSDKSDFQKVEIFETDSQLGRVLTLDDLMMTTEGDEFHYHEMIAHIPMMHHKCPKSVLVIGGGDGGTVREVLKHKTVERVVLCEIDGMVIEACKKYLPTIACELDNPKVEIRVADAIEYIKDKSLGESPVVAQIDKIDPMPKNRRNEPCAWTDLVADSMRSELKTDIAIVNAANTRKVPQEGKLTRRDIEESSPMKNKLLKTTITQKQLVDAIKQAAKETMSDKEGVPGLLHVSGAKYKIDKCIIINLSN